MKLEAKATESKQSLPVDFKTREHNFELEIAAIEKYIAVDFVSSNEALTAEFYESKQDINAGFVELHIVEIDKEAETYNGSYTVTPKAYEQSLKTTGYRMADDVTVKEIPYFEVSNNAGGNTLNIG